MKSFETDVRKSPIVFLCSPYADLIEEREAVIHVLEKLKLRHNCMEFFGARTEKPIETSLSGIIGQVASRLRPYHMEKTVEYTGRASGRDAREQYRICLIRLSQAYTAR